VRDNGDSSVTATQLGRHLDLTRQRICQLVAEHLIEPLPDGRHFNQDICRVRYLRWLRGPERRSARVQADADFVRAKTELIDIRIREKKRDLIETDEAIAAMEKLIATATVLAAMGGMGARCAGHDLLLRRKIDQVVYETRVSLAETFNKFADEAKEPPLRSPMADDLEEDDEVIAQEPAS
jgi:hypothetical protein